MTVINPLFLAGLEELRIEYRRSLPQRLAQVCALWQQALKGENPAEALAKLERCAHSLAGSGGTFGYARLGDAARNLELTVSPLVDSARTLTATAQVQVSRAIEVLRISLLDASAIQAGTPEL